MRIIKFGKSQVQSASVRFYCRHHNKLVGCCPRQSDIQGCPVRRECPAFDEDCAGGSGDPRSGQA